MLHDVPCLSQVPTTLCTASETRKAVAKNVLTDLLLSNNKLTGVYSEYSA